MTFRRFSHRGSGKVFLPRVRYAKLGFLGKGNVVGQ
jgi:hypothetical protein